MKYNAVRKSVNSVGEISQKKIKMSFNSKASELIFGQIHPDIKKAVVRELFTNAWDSQKIANNLQTPIEIHLPTKWEPHFSIRDYGVGMTPQVIDDIYSVVFESSKDDSNEQAGKFGMGSKSPWGYTDSFSLTSYVDGIYWYYELYMNEVNEPIIALKATGETTEPNGVEVSLGVLEEDFNTFKEHAERFALMANTPISINREKFLRKREVLKEGDGWQFYKVDDDNPTVTQIRMGCVLYSLNMSYIRSYCDYYDERLQHFSKPFVLDFDIGDFEITGSREDIIYDKEAVNKLLEKMDNAISVFKAEAFVDIQNSNSYYEAWIKLQEYGKTGFAPSNPKYGALVLDKSSVSTRIPFHRNPLKKKRVKAFDSSTHMYLSNLYNQNLLRNYFLIRQKDEKIKNFNSRIENFVDKLQMQKLQYSRNTYHGRMFDFYIVEYNKLSDLKRLHVYAPKNSIFVEIKDIEKKSKEVRIAGQRDPMSAKFLKMSKYNALETSYNFEEVEDGSYYIRATYSNFHADDESIKKAMKYFKIDLTSENISVIGDSQQHYITKLNLVDLIQKYKDDTIKTRYNDDTMMHYAIKALEKAYNFDYRYLIADETFRISKFPELNYDLSNVEENFDQYINPDVISEFEILIEKIKLVIETYMTNNPLYKFIEQTTLTQNFVEIEKILGEL